jgi:hypothetical protein
MAASKPSGQGSGNRLEVDDRNMIEITLGDMSEEDQRWIKEEMRQELEEVVVVKLRDKLACY